MNRVRAATRHSGEPWPTEHVTPAAFPTAGCTLTAGGDLALATTVLAAGRVPREALDRTMLLGELALDGQLRTLRGVVPAVLAAHRAGFARAIVPADNAAEGALVPGIEVLAATELAEVLRWPRGHTDCLPRTPYPVTAPHTRQPGLTDVAGFGRRRAPVRFDTRRSAQDNESGRHG